MPNDSWLWQYIKAMMNWKTQMQDFKLQTHKNVLSRVN